MYIRTRLVAEHDFTPNMLTKTAHILVSAVCQSFVMEEIAELLTEKEQEIIRRARNYRTNNKAKNAGLSEYKRATALEALIGFLYLKGDTARLIEIEQKCFSLAEQFLQQEREKKKPK